LHPIFNINNYLPPPYSIADINQALCDDGLVDKDKIGGSNYYWSFPAKKDRLLQLEHDDTLLKINELRSSVKDAEARLADAKRGREEEDAIENGGGGGDDNEEEGGSKNETRASKMARRVTLLAELARAQIELEKLKQNDPREIANLEKELTLVTDAANRWTDNIFSCKDYLVKKRGMMKAEGECRVREMLFCTHTLLFMFLFICFIFQLNLSLSDEKQRTSTWVLRMHSIVSCVCIYIVSFLSPSLP
jgi:hypothetical protein